MKVTINEQLLRMQSEQLGTVMFGLGEVIEITTLSGIVKMGMGTRLMVLSAQVFNSFLERVTMFVTRLSERSIVLHFKVIDDQLQVRNDQFTYIPLRACTDFMTRISEGDVQKAVRLLYREGEDGSFEGDPCPHLNQRMRALRGSRTLKDVSDATGLSVSYLSDMENVPKTVPSLIALQKLANFYDITISDMLRGITIEREGEIVPRKHFGIRPLSSTSS